MAGRTHLSRPIECGPVTGPTLLEGDPVAEALRTRVRAALDTLDEYGVTPRLGTVLMTDDDAATSFMDHKHERCAELGVPTRRVDLPADAPAERCYDAVERLADADDVTALFVQAPLPAHVDEGAVRDRIPPAKDIDCFAPENLGRLVAGDPRVTPATPAGVLRLLDWYDVGIAGRDAVIVGRTTSICRPLAARLLDRDATVTICHTRTDDLTAQTGRADLLVTAAGTPGLVDGSMLKEGATVVDISVNRIDADTEKGYELVGDIDLESASDRVDAITSVPGGVGPLTLVSLLANVIEVTARQAGVEVSLEPA
jgi:methylenetetrahydrofolate dehydrogenase (NADP+)/methenyltetrahydrofolate cyclohydrolase